MYYHLEDTQCSVILLCCQPPCDNLWRWCYYHDQTFLIGIQLFLRIFVHNIQNRKLKNVASCSYSECGTKTIALRITM